MRLRSGSFALCLMMAAPVETTAQEPDSYRALAVGAGGVVVVSADRSVKYLTATATHMLPTLSPARAVRFDLAGTVVCALKLDSRIACFDILEFAALPAPPGEFLEYTVSAFFGCGIRPDMSLACWPTRPLINYGQADLEHVFENVPDGTFSRVRSNTRQVCAIRSDKVMLCWGFGPDDNWRDENVVDVSLGYVWDCTLTREATGPSRLSCRGLDLPSRLPESLGLRNSLNAVCFDTVDLRGSCFGRGVGLPAGSEFDEFALGDGSACALSAGALTCWGQLAGTRERPTTATTLPTQSAETSRNPRSTATLWTVFAVLSGLAFIFFGWKLARRS